MNYSSHQGEVTALSLCMASFFPQAEQCWLARPLQGLHGTSKIMSRQKSYSLCSFTNFISDVNSAWAVIQKILARCSDRSFMWSSTEGSGLDAVIMKWLCLIGDLLILRFTLQGDRISYMTSIVLLIKNIIKNEKAKENQEQGSSFIFTAALSFPFRKPLQHYSFYPKYL